MSVWGNWIAYSPILAIGSGLGAGYLLSIFVPPDHVLNTWKLTLVDLSWLKPELTLRLNMQFIVGTLIMLTVWTIQHAGILRTAYVQIALSLGGLLPLVLACFQIGRAHVCTPVTNAQLVCRLLIEKKKLITNY